MVIVRGVNVYPTAVERIIREHAEIAEYRVELGKSGVMDEIAITIEPTNGCAAPAALAAKLESRAQERLRASHPRIDRRARRAAAFRDEGETMGAPMKTGKLLLELNGVSKDYGDGDVLRDVNLRLDERRSNRDRGSVRIRQKHAAEHHRDS